MIRNEVVAKKALELMETAQTTLMAALELVRANCSENECEAFQREIAQVKGRLFFNVMEPIYREHPSLTPPDTPQEFLESWRK